MNSRDCLPTASSPRAPLILRKLCPESSSRALDRREVKRACASEPRLLSANNGRHLQTLLTGDAAAATNPVLGAPRRRLMTLDDSSGSVMWTSHRAPMASSRSLDAVSRLPRLVFRWIAWVQLRAAHTYTGMNALPVYFRGHSDGRGLQSDRHQPRWHLQKICCKTHPPYWRCYKAVGD